MRRTMTGAQIARKLRERAAAMRNGGAADALRAQVVAVVVDDALTGFQRSENPNGRAWAPLKKPRRDGTTKPLMATGNLLAAVRSLRSTPGRNGDGGMDQVATRAPYARFHQTGTRRMPARKFLGIGARGQSRLDREVAKWANEWIAGMLEG